DALPSRQDAPGQRIHALGEVVAVAAGAVQRTGRARAVDDGRGGPLAVGGAQLGVEDLPAHALPVPALEPLDVVGAARLAHDVHVHLAGAAPAVDELHL